MHEHNLRLVATRVIDRFKNIGYDIKVQTVQYQDGIPVGFCDPWESKYFMNKSISHLGAELPVGLSAYMTDQLNKCKVRAVEDLDQKIKACELAVLVFPDDFQEHKNLLQNE